MLESIYYVISWVCRRACPHCYDERFKPYPEPDAARLAEQSRAVFPQVVRHLPETMGYTDLEAVMVSARKPPIRVYTRTKSAPRMTMSV